MRGRLVLAALFLVALVPRAYHLRSPFMNYSDHDTANFSIFARNHLQHGLRATKLGQVMSLGETDPLEFRYFEHHPPLVALLSAGSFALLGRTEAAARALPVLLSAATCPLIFRLGLSILGAPSALLAALLFAFCPGAVYYGQMLNPQAFIVFLGLLSLLAWRAHAVSGRRPAWRAALALMVLAILCDWPGTYLFPALAVASLLAPETRSRGVRLSLQAGAAALLTAVAAIAHIVWIQGSGTDLREAFDLRVFSSPGEVYTWPEYVTGILRILRTALTAPGFRLAALGALALAAVAAWNLRAAGRAWTAGLLARFPGAVALGAATGLFTTLHHVFFTNACLYNEQITYYLIVPSCLLAGGAAAALGAVLSPALGRRAPAAAWLIALVVLAPFPVQAVRQGWFYYNGESYPGWSLLGQELDRLLPADDMVLSPTSLTNPQLEFSLWRVIANDKQTKESLRVNGEKAHVVRDLNDVVSQALEAALAELPCAPVLNFSLCDLRRKAPPPVVVSLRRPPVDWSLVDAEFGGALALTMAGLGPARVGPPPVPRLDRFLGVAWTPERAAGRIVHATFVWQRLEGEARALRPVYSLSRLEDGLMWPAARMWPRADGESTLAGLSPGETARHEVDWFLGEWLPQGEYKIYVEVAGPSSSLPRSDPSGAATAADSVVVGAVALGPATGGE